MITDRQRELVRQVWPGDRPFPSDEVIDRAHRRWLEEASEDNSLSDFYFDFGLALETYTPAVWLRLFED